ncbi:growth hormone-inducible transmembrane protein-like [Uranotaenia lowii]|uniref:growth hormone-inducible transmembrane protein-like n=1 Tax=Uranotaenia lowii TaxID=190385 RepID=UPI002479DCFB|nr:growth hormone-inducible transmembrane protein-like [Uranotaenia lowii]XP_055614407.1 growth hormone-inducible transmembrane protein-like [Uranotaenia lowii]
MLSRFACSSRTFVSAPLLRSALQQNVPRRQPIVREYARNVKGSGENSWTARAERQTLRDKAMAPPGPGAYALGKGALAGGAALGLGALCFYGLGFGQTGTSTLENAHVWPEFVKQRIRDTYLYFGGSLAISAASAVAVFRSPTMLNLVSRNGWMSILATFAVMIGSGMLAQSIPYSPGIGAKQLAWVAHSAILGAVIAPICFVGGPILVRAAWYTAGVVGGLSTVAACAPSDKFLYMGGPLAIGLGVVFASSLGSMFLPPTTALGAGLASMSLYGGLLLFSGFLLYDTQKIVKRAELYPLYAPRPFDPVNSAMSIYMDTMNIFIRIATILAGGGGNRRK